MHETRVIVCGGRDFQDRKKCFDTLDGILQPLSNVEIVSGHASGADALGEEYAKEHQLRLCIFKPEWNKYGGFAGPIRNSQMLNYATKAQAVVIAFWDGNSKGTKNMIEQSQRANADVHIIRY